MDAIQNWLNSGRDYHTGVQLYLEHGTHGLLKKLFSQESFSEFKQQQLETALTNLVQPVATAIPQASVENSPKTDDSNIETIVDVLADVMGKPAVASLAGHRKGWPLEMDAYAHNLFDKWKPLYAEMNDLQARLESVARGGQQDPAKKDEAGRMALRIIELDKQCDAIYTQRDYYFKNGKPMEEGQYSKPLDISLDPKQWPLKLQNHQRYLREYKAKLENETDAKKKERLQANITHQETMVAEYKSRLNID